MAKKARAAKPVDPAPAMHKARLTDARAAFKEVDGKVKALLAKIKAVLGKAGDDPDHLVHAEAFLRDVGLKADEIIAWIDRALPGKKA
jgi:enamine deaminase RidA (YjgF/YER057c/UK114 family)